MRYCRLKVTHNHVPRVSLWDANKNAATYQNEILTAKNYQTECNLGQQKYFVMCSKFQTNQINKNCQKTYSMPTVVLL